MGIIITSVSFIIISNFIEIKYSFYIISNLMILMISNVFLQFLRGLGFNDKYSKVCIITGLTTLICNIIFIIFCKMNAYSILLSSTIANLICIIVISFKLKLTKIINLKYIKKNMIKQILCYSCPMIPNSLSWWIVNVSDRTIISFFLGVSFNAIYTISCKFSNILNSVFSIFNMSWQETASIHINDEDSDVFFTHAINKLLIFFSSISLLIIAVLPFGYKILIGNQYLNSYIYIPILLYANSWNVLISLIGGVYIAKKKTKEIACTTVYSSILNIIINFTLIKYIGLYAACLSTLISYIVMGLYRVFDCRKYINFKLNTKELCFFSLIFLICSILYILNNVITNILSLIIACMYFIFENRNYLLEFIKKLKKSYKNLRKEKKNGKKKL